MTWPKPALELVFLAVKNNILLPGGFESALAAIYLGKGTGDFPVEITSCSYFIQYFYFITYTFWKEGRMTEQVLPRVRKVTNRGHCKLNIINV